MNLSTQLAAEAIKTKSALVARYTAKDGIENILESVDKLLIENAEEMSNRLSVFNEKIKSFNLIYNPFNDSVEETQSKTKFVGGCSECRTFTEVLSRLCENYGCVADNLTTQYESENSDSFIVSKLNPISNRVTVQQRGADVVQSIRATNDPSTQCLSVPMLAINIQEGIRKEAVTGCLVLDAFAIATESLDLSAGKAIDQAILYGNWDPTANSGAGGYVAISNFDSLDLLIPSAQKLTSTDAIGLYSQMINSIASIQDQTGCGIEDIAILMRAGVQTRILGALDNVDRPIFSELGLMGASCEDLKVACKGATPCQSVLYQRNSGTGVITTDIWIGHKRDYAFGKYLMTMTDPRWDMSTNAQYLLQHNRFVGGKLLNTASFYKITATLG
jgi:hypothetical protein